MAKALLPAPALAARIRDSGYRFVVTGAGGWIGQAALEMLESALGDGFADRVSAFGSTDRSLTLRSGRTLTCHRLDEISRTSRSATIFLHCAFLTKDRLTDQSVANFVSANAEITRLVTGALESGAPAGLFMPSSGAVYRNGGRVLDDDLSSNPYGVQKRQCEIHFLNITQNLGIPATIPRLFNLSGPFINKHELYALSSMIVAVLEERSISIRAAHRVIRSYVYVADLINLAMACLLDPMNCDQAVFDTAGEEELEMADLAEAIRVAVGRPAYPVERPTLLVEPVDRYVGDGAAMARMLSARGLRRTELQEQIIETASYLADFKASS